MHAYAMLARVYVSTLAYVIQAHVVLIQQYLVPQKRLHVRKLQSNHSVDCFAEGAHWGSPTAFVYVCLFGKALAMVNASHTAVSACGYAICLDKRTVCEQQGLAGQSIATASKRAPGCCGPPQGSLGSATA